MDTNKLIIAFVLFALFIALFILHFSNGQINFVEAEAASASINKNPN